MQRADTEQNLSMVTRRNDGRRRSLVGQDFAEPSSGNSSIDEIEDNVEELMDEVKPSTVPSSATGKQVSESQQLRNRLHSRSDFTPSEISKTIKEIDRMNSGLRLKNRGKKTSLTDSELVDDAFRSKFSDIEFYSQPTTIFDAEYFKNSEFFGIYILFWLGTGFMMLSNLVHSYFETKLPFYERPVSQILRKDLLQIGLTDLGMYVASYGVYLIQVACSRGYLQWNSVGKKVHVLYEFAHFFFFFKLAEHLGFHWIGKVFLGLHLIVFLMKMHSYGFYNGYLWNILGELEFSESYLARLESGEATLPSGYELESTKKTLKNSITFCKFELEYQTKASVIVDKSELKAIPEKVLSNLDMKDLHNNVEFPNNITLFNFFEYSLYPTVVYTLHYTRTEKIRWGYVAEKVVGIFGIIFLMLSVADNMMYPIVLRAVKAREELPVGERFAQYGFILLDMIPPFLLEYLFTFFLIWDSILNAIAELSRFADRDFYGPWWSCSDWAEFARIWNRPVHKFLLRHVYHSSLSTLNLNKMQSSLFTFLLSSIVHELVMYIIFRRWRGYLFCLQMSQLPLVMIGNMKFMKGRKVLGNVICWIGFISGPSLICTAYLMF